MSSPSKRTLEFLAQDVRNTEAEITDLDAQIADLKAKREAKAITLESMRDALGRADLAEVPVPHSDEEPPRITPPEIMVRADRGGSTHGAFRSAIRAVLHDATRGMRTRDVHNELRLRGVLAHYTGKSDPVMRTSGELSRMAKAGQIKKRGQLYYSIGTH